MPKRAAPAADAARKRARLTAGLADRVPITEPPVDGDDWRVVHSQVQLTAANVDGLDLGDVLWQGSRLTGTTLSRLRAVDVVFRDCDLSGVDLDRVVLTRVEFHDCRLSGLIVAGGTLSDVLFENCRLDGANFRQIKGNRLHAADCDFTGADFAGAVLTGSRLQGSTLVDVDFNQAKVAGLRLHESRLEGLRGVSFLTGAVIGPAQAVGLGLQMLAANGVVVEPLDP